MKTFGQQIARLIDLKSIITASLTGALVFGFLTDKIPQDQFMPIVFMVFTYYFTKKQINIE
jgi:hypothetical protein